MKLNEIRVEEKHENKNDTKWWYKEKNYCIDIDDYVQLCQYIDIECLKIYL